VFPLDWTDPESGEKSSGYKEQGYFAEAFINMLAFLGWNPGTTEELFSLDRLVQSFTLERVGKAGAKFDLEKAHWYNQRYLRDKSDTDLAVLLQPYLAEAGISSDIDYIAKVCNLMKERATFISDMVEGSYFFNAPKEYDEKMVRKKWKDNTPSMIEGFSDKLSSMSDFSSANIDMEFKAYLESNDISMGEIMPILRILIAGVTSGPSIFDVISVIGKQEALNRIEVGLEKIPALSIA
jgi:glutamyl-tRNA synthetase